MIFIQFAGMIWKKGLLREHYRYHMRIIYFCYYNYVSMTWYHNFTIVWMIIIWFFVSNKVIIIYSNHLLGILTWTNFYILLCGVNIIWFVKQFMCTSYVAVQALISIVCSQYLTLNRRHFVSFIINVISRHLFLITGWTSDIQSTER